jgi:hypothetical protein
MSKDKDPNSWGYGGVRRRDFQHTHDGPEELPPKKKAKKKKVERCKHNYEFVSEISWPSWNDRADRIYRKYECSLCGKKKTEGPIYQ